MKIVKTCLPYFLFAVIAMNILSVSAKKKQFFSKLKNDIWGGKIKEGEVCSRHFGNDLKCEAGLICKKNSEGVKVCQKEQKITITHEKKKHNLAKAGETCYQSIRGFEKKTCPAGYECRATDETVMRGLKGAASVCLKEATRPISVMDGGDCHYDSNNEETGKPNRLCKRNSTCMKGICQNNHIKHPVITVHEEIHEKVKLVGPNEVCYRSTPNFGKRKCPEGYECRPHDSYYQGMATTGGANVCLKESTKPVLELNEGEDCHYDRHNEESGKPNRMCKRDLTCRKGKCESNQIRIPVEPKHEKVKLVGPNEVCYRSTPNFGKRKCPEGYECRPHDSYYQGMATTGGANVCLKESTKPVLDLNEGEDCHYDKNNEETGKPNRMCKRDLTCRKGKCQSNIKKLKHHNRF